MGLSMLTAIRIKKSKLIISSAGPVQDSDPKFDGKFAGWICVDTDRFEPLVSTEPVYDTPDAAEDAMKDIVKKVKASKEIP